MSAAEALRLPTSPARISAVLPADGSWWYCYAYIRSPVDAVYRAKVAAWALIEAGDGAQRIEALVAGEGPSLVLASEADDAVTTGFLWRDGESTCRCAAPKAATDDPSWCYGCGGEIEPA